MDGQDQGSAVIFQRTAESNFAEDQEQTGLIQRAQQGFPGISPMCTQEAHSGHHQLSKSLPHICQISVQELTWLELH